MSKSKPTILIVDDEPAIVQLLEIMIESELEVDIHRAYNGEEAIEILEENTTNEENPTSSINLILSDYTMPKSTGGDLYQYNKGKANLPFILVSAGFLEDYNDMKDFADANAFNTFLQKPFEREDIIAAVRNALGNIGDEAPLLDTIREEKGLKKVKSYFLSKLAKESFDLFIKLGDGKFLQVCSKENDDMKGVLEHYRKKEQEVTFFYLSDHDYERFFLQVKNLLEEFKDSSNKTYNKTEVTFTALDFAFSVAQEQVEALGVSKVHQDFINSSIDRICSDLKSSKDLFSVLKGMLTNDDYISEHSILNIYFSTYMLDKLNWSSDQTLKQMLYAAFYHDIEIKDATLAKISHLDQCADYKEKNFVKAHGNKAAKIVEQLPGLNHDAHKIILDHHEKPDGTGFPLGLTASNLPPLSCIFILSHEIVDFLIENDFKTQYLASKIQEMEKTWAVGNFKRPFDCLRSILMD